MRYSPEHFIRTWQAASTLADVATALSMTAQSAKSKASRYRKRGIPLAKMAASGGVKLDCEELARVARECTL